jgi:hypothetical protein
MLKSFRTGCVFFFYARSHGQLQYHLCVGETRVAANDSWRTLGTISDRAAQDHAARERALPSRRVVAFERRLKVDA